MARRSHPHLFKPPLCKGRWHTVRCDGGIVSHLPFGRSGQTIAVRQKFLFLLYIESTVCYTKYVLFFYKNTLLYKKDRLHSMPQILKICTGDVLELKKPHPCGEKLFTVVRLGSDVRIICKGCGRDITLPRVKLEKAVKKIHPASTESSAKG